MTDPPRVNLSPGRCAVPGFGVRAVWIACSMTVFAGVFGNAGADTSSDSLRADSLSRVSPLPRVVRLA